MEWEFRSAFNAFANEFRGWRKFRKASGVWPVYSMIYGVISPPIFFISVTFGLLRAFETHRLAVIYSVLFFVVICGAAAWYGLRRLARKLDLVRAKSAHSNFPTATLEEFIR
jgi:hypothetical protein